ncbi:hypothetical protein [Streptomyces sp. NPDC015125]|uniref:hypothetical protein n=1 Tax=Streptomyces sp. NPDC015125 TaxID=3364938 RepID=UPI0036F8D04E
MHRGSRARPPVVIGRQAKSTRSGVDRGLLVDLSANPGGTLHHPDQVAEVCQRQDLAALVAADTPIGPEQAATRWRVRRADFDHMVRLGWVRSPQSIEVRIGTSRAGAVALYTTASVDALVPDHPEIDWEQLRAVARCAFGVDGDECQSAGGHFGDQAGGVPAFTVPQIDEPGCGWRRGAFREAR